MMKAIVTAVLVATGIAGCASLSRDRIALPEPASPAWKAECGGCHDLYPPMLLTAGNWNTMMQQLDRHFGFDARVPEPTRKEISAFLLDHGAPDHSYRHASENLRITRTTYFLSAHGGSSIPLWSEADDRKASNCSACHKSEDGQPW